MRQTTQTTIKENGIQRNITKAEADELYKEYDLVVKTQEQLVELFSGPTNYKSIAILNTFTMDEPIEVIQTGGLSMPNGGTIAGIGKPVIKLKLNQTGSGSVVAFKGSDDHKMSVSGISIYITNGTGLSSQPNIFQNVFGIDNCVIYANVTFGLKIFYQCESVTNCIISIDMSNSGQLIMAQSTRYISNCDIDAKAIYNGVSYIFRQCYYITNVTVNIDSEMCSVYYSSMYISGSVVNITTHSGINGRSYKGFERCQKISNCVVTATYSQQTSTVESNVIGFDRCFFVSNCEATLNNLNNGGTYAYSSCSFVSNFRSTTSIIGGSNTWIDDKTVSIIT